MMFDDPDSGRTRIVTRQWERAPEGPLLTKPPPAGMRAPNGLIWAHNAEDFFWLERLPGAGVLTIWSRSMLREFGENYTEDEFDEPEHRPRVRRPWPVLRLRRGAHAYIDPPLGAMDEGSDHEDDEKDFVRYHILEDDDEPGVIDDECCCGQCGIGDDDDDIDEENMVSNDPVKPVISDLGVPYSRLWNGEMKKNFEYALKHGIFPPLSLVGCKRVEGKNILRGKAADHIGLFPVLVKESIDPKDGSTHRNILGPLVCIHAPGEESCCKIRRALRENATKGKAPAVSARKIKKKNRKKNKKAAAAAIKEKAPAAAAQEEPLADEATPSGVIADASAAPAADNHPKKEDVDIPMKDVPVEEDISMDAEPEHDSAAADDSDDPMPFDSPAIEPENIAEAPKEDAKPEPWVSLDDRPTTFVPSASRELYEELPAFDSSLFDTAELPKLEEFIPEEFFPDALMVHTLQDDGASERVRKYVRLLPTLDRNPLVEKDGQADQPPTKRASTQERVAHLYTRTSLGMYEASRGGAPPNRLGVGNHSSVQRAPLVLPEPITARSHSGQVTVAAKTARGLASARNQLRNEAHVYAAFPKHLMEEWCGYNLVTPIKHPVPLGAVVPKFYGYYVPVGDDGEWDDLHWPQYSEDNDRRVESDSPILLMEECGEPIKPDGFTLDQRSECYSLILRLHYANFIQQSMYIRNVLAQPGPLTEPPHRRSASTPSFRIIDFGRSMNWTMYMNLPDRTRAQMRPTRPTVWRASPPEGDILQAKMRDWYQLGDDEQKRAQDQLRIDNWEY